MKGLKVHYHQLDIKGLILRLKELEIHNRCLLKSFRLLSTYKLRYIEL